MVTSALSIQFCSGIKSVVKAKGVAALQGNRGGAHDRHHSSRKRN